MNNYDKILDLMNKNHGYVTTKEVVDNGIDRKFLSNMVKNGTIVRISRGYYGLPDSFEDVFYKVISKSENAVFSLATALYLHNLSDRTPLVYDITVPYGYGGPLQSEPKVDLTYVKRDILTLGLIQMESPFGMKIPVYDVERTICDIIKCRYKMDGEIFSKALKDYVRSKDKDLYKLHEYAKIMNIEKKVTEYMEVLL